MSVFSNRLKELRTEHSLSQKQLAAETGISWRAIQSYELCARVPLIDVCTTLADYFEVPSDYLLGVGIYKKVELLDKFSNAICQSLQRIKLSDSFHEFVLKVPTLPDSKRRIFFASLLDDIEIKEDQLLLFWKFR